MKTIEYNTAYFNSPIGLIKIKATKKGITSLQFVEGDYKDVENKDIPDNIKECIKQLTEYFKGTRQTFTIELDLQGSPFQLSVWKELLNIKFGETVSYIQIAEKIRNKTIVRAVGNANGKNPIVIIVPCHRVIGAQGNLIGYSSGLWRKDWLINFEKKYIQGSLF